MGMNEVTSEIVSAKEIGVAIGLVEVEARVMEEGGGGWGRRLWRRPGRRVARSSRVAAVAAVWAVEPCPRIDSLIPCRIAEYYLVLIVVSMGCLYRSTNLESK
jgi:hypothetical protein